jgi:uncharacterized surface protein with fasciclin (FAS1) repeats
MRSRTISMLALVTAATFGLAACGSDTAKTTDTTVVASETVPGEGAEPTVATEEPTVAEDPAEATTVAEGTETTAVEATETSAPAEGGATTVAAGGEAAGGEKDIVDTAVAAGNFTILAKLLTDAGLIDTLKGEGPFTVFAPTDEAFAKVPAETLASLGTDKEALKKVLTYHVVAGKVMAADVKPGEVPTLAGPNITIKAEGGKVMVNDANVVTTDIVAKNGVIHVIDAVLLPPAA